MVKRNNYVEVGRVCCLNFGPDAGKLVTVVDFIDQTRVLVDGNINGVGRQSVPFRWLSLTDIKCGISRGARSGTIAKVWAKEDVLAQWSKTNWAKKIAMKAQRASNNDFARFNVMLLRKQRSRAINREAAKLRRAASKAKRSE